jgi:hypothetical protein
MNILKFFKALDPDPRFEYESVSEIFCGSGSETLIRSATYIACRTCCTLDISSVLAYHQEDRSGDLVHVGDW